MWSLSPPSPEDGGWVFDLKSIKITPHRWPEAEMPLWCVQKQVLQVILGPVKLIIT